MSSLSSIINTYNKSPSAIVRVNNVIIPNIFSIRVSRAMGEIATATIEVDRLNNVYPEDKVVIELGYNSVHRTVFTGFVDTIDFDEEEKIYIVNCRDVLKKAVDTYFIQEVAFGIDVDSSTYYYSTYSNLNGGTFTQHIYSSLSALNTNHPETTGNYSNEGVRAEAVVQWILAMTGLREGSEIQVDSTNFWIGDITPAKFHLTSAYDAVMQIADLIGWYIFADESGVARFKKRPRNPSGFPQWSYDSINNPYNIFSVKSSTTNTDLRNYVEVRGHNGIRHVARAPSPFIGNTPYRGVLISNELIDTPSIASFVANRVLADLNRLKLTINIEADGNPFLRPGDTVQVRTSTIDGMFLVESVEHAISAEGFFTSLVLSQFYNDTVFEERPHNVVADFTFTASYSIGDPRFIVTLDASSSYSERGSIVHYQWTWPDSSQTTSSDPTAWYVFSDTQIMNSSVPVTLTVTDNYNVTASVTKNITYQSIVNATGKPKTRALYAALTNRAAGSLDGGQTWYEQNVSAISCSASNFGPNNTLVTSGYAIFGCSDNTIRRTVDACQTMQIVLNNAGAPVTYVNVMEKDSRYAVAGTSNGRIYVSNDFGVTWTLKHTLPFPIHEVRYGFNQNTYLLAVGSGVGNVYHSFDGGANWSAVGGLLNTLTVNRESSGAVTNYFAHTSGIVSASGQILFAGDVTPNIRTLSIMIDRDDGIMAVDTDGQHWVFSGSRMQPTQNNPTNRSQHMLRDGEIPMLVYYANASGVGKSLDRNTTMEQLYVSGSGGRMVWYGHWAEKPVPGNVVAVLRGDYTGEPGFYTLTNTNLSRPICVATTSGWVSVANRHQYADGQWSFMPGVIFTRSSRGLIGRCRLFEDNTIVWEPNWQSLDTPWYPQYDTAGHGIINNYAFETKYLLLFPGGDLGRADAVVILTNPHLNTTTRTELNPFANNFYRAAFTKRSLKFAGRSITDSGYIHRPGRVQFDPNTNSFNWQPYFAIDWNRSYLFYVLLGDDSVIAYNGAGSQGAGWYRFTLGQAFFAHGLNAGPWSYSEAGDGSTNVQWLYESAVHPGRIYVCDSQNIYYIDQYGMGQRRVLWTIPQGITGIRVFRVTHDMKLTKDYITVACYDSTHERIFYSTDAGRTWYESNSIRRPTGGHYVSDVAYIDRMESV